MSRSAVREAHGRTSVGAVNAIATLKTAWAQASARQASLLAAGVAFYLFTSLFPAMIAAVSIYGLVADPDTVARQSDRISEALPADAASIITGQLEQLVSTSSGSLGVGAVIAILLAVYAASGGIGNLVTAINTVYGIEDDRSFIAKKLIALGLTAGALVFGLFALTLVAILPIVMQQIDAVPGVRILTQVARWALLAGGIIVAVGVLFRVAPNRRAPGPLVTRGVILAALICIAVSVGFSVYVDNFGNYAKTYGALAGVVVLLLWLWIGMFAILLGACVEATREQVVTPATVAADAAVATERAQEANIAADLDEFTSELDRRHR